MHWITNGVVGGTVSLDEFVTGIQEDVEPRFHCSRDVKRRSCKAATTNTSNASVEPVLFISPVSNELGISCVLNSPL
jgi:hypothetical protein